MNYQSKLKINEKYDFDNLLSEILSSEAREIRNELEPLRQFTDGTPKMDKILKMTLKHLTAASITGASKMWRVSPVDKEEKVKPTPKLA